VEKVLEAIDLHKTFPGVPEEIRVLEGVNLAVKGGEVVAIVGASGVGKSTLLHILGALDRPTSGTVILDSEDLFSSDGVNLAQVRSRSVGFVFQFHHLLREFTALENVMMPALISGSSREEAQDRGEELLRDVGVWERRTHRPAHLSGGEQQRVAVARALINDPYVVLADEPSGNLDQAHSRSLHDLIWSLREKKNQTFVVATHDLELAGQADRALTLRDGLLHEGISVEITKS
jgi:lipoprotein-releasing system ATP-binding protein